MVTTTKLSIATLSLCLGYVSAQAAAQYQNCTVPDVNSLMHTEFPPQMEIPQLVSNDTQANDLFAQLLAAGGPALDIEPKGTPDGTGNFDATMQTYDVQNDPDCWFTTTHCVDPKHEGLSQDIYSCDAPSTWALSFDDGPTCFNDVLYDFLREHNIKASMYYIGQNVLNFPLQARKGFEDGHIICAHTWTHHYLTSLTNEQVFAELYYGKKALKRVLGVDSRCFRPPYGDVDDRVRTIAKFLDLTIEVWDQDTNDWQANLPGDNSTRAVNEQYDELAAMGGDGAGITVLSHESTINVINAFIRAFPNIQGNFTNIVPIHACANMTRPYLDDNIVFPNMQQYLDGEHDPEGLPSPMVNNNDLQFAHDSVANITSAAGGTPNTRSGAAEEITASGIEFSTDEDDSAMSLYGPLAFVFTALALGTMVMF